jgi:mono/diheme cytochrome c family protein
MDELLAKAAEAMKMPEGMVRRSAEARAKAEGMSVEEVLADWAGVESPASESVAEPEAAAEAPAEGAVEEAPAEKEAPAERAPATGIDLYVETAAEKMRMPASMIRRSAEARARTEDRSYEEVLAEWAEVDVAEVRAAAEESKPPEAEPETATAEDAEATAEDAEGEEPPSEEPAEEAEEPADEAEELEVDVEVVGGDDEPFEEQPEEEPAFVGAGSGLPRWLLTLFVIVPAFAIGYAAFFPNGPNCGDAGRLAVDPVTGLAVNCDGTAYGERITDFLAIGAENYAVCAGCHGAGGSGSGAGPAFTGGALLATFPEGQCELHVEWVSIGTNAWPDSTYGANDKPVGGFGVMPGFGNILSDEELRAVVLYERVQFAGEVLDDAIADCGLGGEAEDGDAPATGDGDEPAGDE